MSATSKHAATVRNLRERLDSALSRRNRHEAVTVAVDAVTAGDIGVVELYTQILGPLLVDTGAAWQTGTLRVWEEHYASATVRTIVEALYPEVVRKAAALPRRGQRILLANPPLELHDLALRMLSDRFELAGYDVTFLGANTPLDEIAAAASTTHTDVVVLSVSTVYERLELREFLDELRTKTPGCRILVGGAAFVRDREWPRAEILDLDEFGLNDPLTDGDR